MVKTLGLAFALLLAYTHMANVQGDAYHRPLSLFRDYSPAWIGYALFVVLLAIGLEIARTAYRVGAKFRAVVYLVATGLLGVVAATPSQGNLHTVCALVAMVALFAYYAVLLYRGEYLFWLLMHLAVPSLLMMASLVESYGIWQKGMILYFLVAAVVHHHRLAQWLPKLKRGRIEAKRGAFGSAGGGPIEVHPNAS